MLVSLPPQNAKRAWTSPMPTLTLPTRRDQAGVTILTSLSPPSHVALQQRTSERMRGVGRKGKEGAEGMCRGFLRAFLFALRAALGEERRCPCLPKPASVQNLCWCVDRGGARHCHTCVSPLLGGNWKTAVSSSNFCLFARAGRGTAHLRLQAHTEADQSLSVAVGRAPQGSPSPSAGSTRDHPNLTPCV